MKEVEKSGFQLRKFKILRSLIELNEEDSDEEATIRFSPKGYIHRKESTFIMDLRINIESKSTMKIDITARAKFNFNRELSEQTISNYFFVNAPALIFPYVRAYVSALTALSGTNVIILPTLNMTAIGNELKENTTTEE